MVTHLTYTAKRKSVSQTRPFCFGFVCLGDARDGHVAKDVKDFYSRRWPASEGMVIDVSASALSRITGVEEKKKRSSRKRLSEKTSLLVSLPWSW